LLLILDFDGVICNSTEECYFVSNLIILDKIFSLKKTDLCSKNFFYKHRYLVKTAGEFFIILNKKINKNIKLTTKDMNILYDKNKELIKIFEKKFYQQRNKLIKNDIKSWLALNHTYQKVLDLIDKITQSNLHHVHIVSLKDQLSINKILKFNNIKNISILGKENVRTKRDSIKYLKKKYNYSSREIIFIDDNVDHLEKVKDLKIKTFLPSWNNELKNSNDLKFEFINLHELDKIFI